MKNGLGEEGVFQKDFQAHYDEDEASKEFCLGFIAGSEEISYKYSGCRECTGEMR